MGICVLLDGLMLGTASGGDATYILGLAQELLNDSRFVPIMAVTKNGESIVKNERIPYVLAKGSRVWGPITLGIIARKIKADIIHTQYFPILKTRIPVVTTVHDLGFVEYSSSFSFFQKAKLGLAVKLSLRKARVIITVSRQSMESVKKFSPAFKDKVICVPNGVQAVTEDFTENLECDKSWPKDYVLWIGNTEPRKNLDKFLAAYEKALPAWPDLKLYAVGSIVLTDVAKIQKSGGSYLGRVDKNLLTCLISCARVVAYPSLFEGFGLPALEAVACGVPALVHQNSPLTDYISKGIITVDCRDVQEMTKGIILCKLLPWTPSEIRNEAKRLSRDRFGTHTMMVYERIMKQ